MAECKNCTHYEVCYKSGWCDDCANYLPTEDVVPKSEVEKYIVNMNAYGLTAKRLAEENEQLKQAEQEVAREIFEEIDKILETQEKYLYCNPSLTYIYELIAELEKKYIGDTKND